jgi:hypothetical protein
MFSLAPVGEESAVQERDYSRDWVSATITVADGLGIDSRGIVVYVRKREPEYTQGGRKSPPSSSVVCRFCRVLVEAYLPKETPRNAASLASRKCKLSCFAPCMSAPGRVHFVFKLFRLARSLSFIK